MRPRKHDLDLPRCVYRKKGIYYFVSRGVWHHLGRDRETALAEVAVMQSVEIMNKADIESFARRIWAQARNNAWGRRRIEFSLRRDDIVPMLEECDWRCAVTRTPFSLVKIGCRNQRPYAPSIDRKDSALGYTKANCRFVCVATNYAMNSWGEGVLRELARNMPRGRVLTTIGNQLDIAA